jgi:hypothetical protein
MSRWGLRKRKRALRLPGARVPHKHTQPAFIPIDTKRQDTLRQGWYRGVKHSSWSTLARPYPTSITPLLSHALVDGSRAPTRGWGRDER